ncbi:MAG: acyltransferase [Prevotellaceae bacterium]|jgi:peptidoglycan/LPS O-acetylase OafA/YrhL|nr:acyltransferase [Prevotellaceae bacterium]
MFFALIAFIAAAKYFASRDIDSLKRQAEKRYFRLMPPVFASVVISYLAFAAGVMFHTELGADVNAYFGITSNWANWMYPDGLSFGGAIINGLLTAFVNNGAGNYNTVTWCIYVIFFGSYLTYGFLALFGTSKKRVIFYAISVVLGVYYQPFSQFLVFIAGIAVADLIESRKECAKKPFLGVALIIFGIALSAFALDIFLGGVITGEALLSVSAFLIIYGLSESEATAKVLSAKFWKPIGNIAFSLILTHTIVLFSLSAFLFHMFYKNVGLSFSIAVTLSCVISLPVIVIVAIVFDRFIEKGAGRLVNKLAKNTRGIKNL